LDSVYWATPRVGAAAYRVQCVDRTTGVVPLGPAPGGKRFLFTINAVASVRQTA
jgi:hypothetical protein